MTYQVSRTSSVTTVQVFDEDTGKSIYDAHFIRTLIKVQLLTSTRTSSSVSLVESKETVYKS
jgi:hypothetical protein